MWVVAAAWADGECLRWNEPESRGRLLGREEVSGIAAARIHRGALFYHEDDDGPVKLRRLADGNEQSTESAFLGTDWEDMAVGACPSGDACSCVWIGDIGDNLADRASVTVWWFPEVPEGVDPAATAWELTWPDQPRDTEGLIVDPSGTIFLVAKDGSAIGRASGPGAMTVLPGPDIGGDTQIMAADASSSGRWVLLRTDLHLWLYAGDTIEAALASTPTALPSPDKRRQEAAAFSADGASIWLTGEGIDPELFEVTCAEFVDDADEDPLAECGAVPPPSGCGCATGGQGSSLILLIAAMIAARRR